jgi:aspartate racemase
MKTIGLIGGMSWESSKHYYEIINTEVKRILGKNNSAECIMYSFNFQKIEEMQYAGEWDNLKNEIFRVGRVLQKAGADFIVVCTNTMHKVLDNFEKELGIPLLHISDVIGESIKKDKIKKIGLLGTRFTMVEDFYRKRIQEKYGIDVVIPDEKGIIEVNRIIYEELVKGDINRSSKEFYENEIIKLMEKGCEGIILGCTEIGMLIKESKYPLYDSTIIHARKAVEIALGR